MRNFNTKSTVICKIESIKPSQICKSARAARYSSFSEMNLPNFAEMFTFYIKYFKPSSKCLQYRFKAFYNGIKNLIFSFDIFKRFLILTEFGKFGRKIRQIRQICPNCQLSLNFWKTQLNFEKKVQELVKQLDVKEPLGILSFRTLNLVYEVLSYLANTK